MDRLQRHYAHTAWTPADPLAGLAAHQRRAILLMPSTFAERLRMAPWRTYEKRRAAMLDIIAERRLLYDLMYDHQQTVVAPQSAGAILPDAPARTLAHASSAGDLSPYYAYRMQLHRHAVEAMAERRIADDLHDLAINPAAQADLALRKQRRSALLDIEMQRRRLDLKEMEVLSGQHDRPAPSPVTGRDADDIPLAPIAPPLRSAEQRRKRGRHM